MGFLYLRFRYAKLGSSVDYVLNYRAHNSRYAHSSLATDTRLRIRKVDARYPKENASTLILLASQL